VSKPDDWLEDLYAKPSTSDQKQRRFWSWKRRSIPLQVVQPGVVAGFVLGDIRWRFASGAIDFAIAFLLPSLFFTGGFKLYGWWLVLGFAIQVANGGVLAAWRGQSIGKMVTKQYLVQIRQQNVGGPIMTYLPLDTAILRQVLHYIDAYTFIGFLLPYWSPKRACIADRMTRSYVVRDVNLQQLTRTVEGTVAW
jgi:ribosomal protein S18 acetylase RimI-like enzyme